MAVGGELGAVAAPRRGLAQRRQLAVARLTAVVGAQQGAEGFAQRLDSLDVLGLEVRQVLARRPLDPDPQPPGLGKLVGPLLEVAGVDEGDEKVRLRRDEV